MLPSRASRLCSRSRWRNAGSNRARERSASVTGEKGLITRRSRSNPGQYRRICQFIELLLSFYYLIHSLDMSGVAVSFAPSRCGSIEFSGELWTYGGRVCVSRPGQPGRRYGQGFGRGISLGAAGLRRGRCRIGRTAQRGHLERPGRCLDAHRKCPTGLDDGLACGAARAGGGSRGRSHARCDLCRRTLAWRIFGACRRPGAFDCRCRATAARSRPGHAEGGRGRGRRDGGVDRSRIGRRQGDCGGSVERRCLCRRQRQWWRAGCVVGGRSRGRTRRGIGKSCVAPSGP